ncbi:homeobox KN domain-containing protein [Aspergillus pseudodeflectus]|uniref:Homeobox KN domain-containing protein n=1 Tax=Aspergillus pseudodeflectus TaxID=176178 RepID=A0ABR4L9Z0_9EURO
MSQYRDRSGGSQNMAISYASGLPADNQALPSFRELLPPHLHEEIESTSYYTSRQPRERPTSSHDVTNNFRPPYASSSKTPFDHRDYLGRASDPHPRTPAHVPSATDATPRYTSRPSPMLPPIRDLQSYPERGMGVYTESRDHSRPELAARSVGSHGYTSASLTGPMDRRGEAYGTAPMHPQMGYPYQHMAYQSDPEHAPSHALSHAPQSNFGILGDPIDPKNKRRRGNLPKPVTDTLRAWFHEHLDHPYPSEEDKQMFMSRTGLTISQISNWFINARRRQLPALRNQMRNGSELDPQRQSPLSDMEQTPSESSPHRRL